VTAERVHAAVALETGMTATEEQLIALPRSTEVPRPAAANSGAAKPLKHQPGQPHRSGREQHVR
jgi:hypothetical protein